MGTNWIDGMDDHARWAVAQHEQRCLSGQVTEGDSVMELPAEYVKVLFDAAMKADAAGLLGKCNENMMPGGGCRVCTVLEQTSWRMEHRVDEPFPKVEADRPH